MYLMKERKVYPEKMTDLEIQESFNFYLQTCSLELSTRDASVAAATLANHGICPITNDMVFNPSTVRNCLSLMYSCGMYDFSGEFGFRVGLPAKSGVGGGILLVIPGVMGMCIWSPRIDVNGHHNSTRGIEYCVRLVEKYHLHLFENFSISKLPTSPGVYIEHHSNISMACYAASRGSLEEITRLYSKGYPLDQGDYDLRTPVHIAAACGNLHIVQFMIQVGCKLDSVDRFGRTPLDDAKQNGFTEVARVIEDALAAGGSKTSSAQTT